MPDFLNGQKINSNPESPRPPQETRGASSPQEVEVLPELQKEATEAKAAPEGVRRETPSMAPPPATGHVAPLSERVVQPQSKSERLVAIENIMASGLEEIYSQLDASTQQMLKAEGEKTASQIEILLEQGKDIAKKILQLIRGWLHKIPGVNKFFLEQESKIKTDKIMAMRREE